jgi:hypothetical protein
MQDLFLATAAALVEDGNFDEAGAVIIGAALETLRTECMQKTGVDPREQVKLLELELKRSFAVGAPVDLSDLKLGVRVVVEAKITWATMQQPLAAAAAKGNKTDKVITPLMSFEAQTARQILSDKKKGIEQSHDEGTVYAAFFEEWDGRMWVHRDEVDVGSTVTTLHARFKLRETHLRENRRSDALVQAMRRHADNKNIRCVLKYLRFKKVNPKIYRGAGALTRFAEFMGIKTIWPSSCCINLTLDVMQFKMLSSEEASAMGESFSVVNEPARPSSPPPRPRSPTPPAPAPSRALCVMRSLSLLSRRLAGAARRGAPGGRGRRGRRRRGGARARAAPRLQGQGW